MPSFPPMNTSSEGFAPGRSSVTGPDPRPQIPDGVAARIVRSTPLLTPFLLADIQGLPAAPLPECGSAGESGAAVDGMGRVGTHHGHTVRCAETELMHTHIQVLMYSHVRTPRV